MNKVLMATFLFACAAEAAAQRHEIGVQVGAANLVGDIGRTNFILQKPLGRVSDYGLPVYLAALYRMNFNPYQTLRFNLGYSNIQFNDAAAKEAYRKNRGLSGTNSVYNADAIFEYNFYPVNNEQKGMLSPYVFGGIGGIIYSKRQTTLDYGKNPEDPAFFQFQDYDNDGKIDNLPDFPDDDRIHSTLKNAMALSIPFGVGLKYKFNYNWALFGEFKFRYTFTDQVDYSEMTDKDIKVISAGDKAVLITNPSDLADIKTRKLSNSERSALAAPYLGTQSVGNKNSKDWVNNISIGISYSFGRPPCYCD